MLDKNCFLKFDMQYAECPQNCFFKNNKAIKSQKNVV